MTKKIKANNKRPLLKRKIFWALLFLAIYALFGVFYAPTIIKRELINQLNQQLNAKTTIEKVSFNPFSFTTKINKLNLNDLQDENWITSENIKLDFDPVRLIFGDWVFSEISIEQPMIKIEILADGKLRFPQIPSSNADSADFSLVLANINIDGGKLEWIDRSIHEDFTLNIKHLSFNQLNFKNRDHDSALSFKIITHNDEILELSGLYNHGQQSFNGDLILSHWKLTTLNEFIPKHLLFHSKQGSLQALGEINWKFSEKPSFEFSQITTDNISLEIDSQPQFDDTNIVLENIKIDLNSNQLSIEKLISEQANIYFELTPPQSTEQTANIENTKNWQVNIGSIETKNTQLHLNDQNLNAVNILELEQLSINQFNLDGQPIDAKITVKTPINGQINLAAGLQLSPLELKIDIDATDIDLASWSKWAEPITNLRIKSGQLTGAQKLKITADSFESSGNLLVEQLQFDNIYDQKIISIKQLQILQSQINSAEKTWTVDQITLDEASGVISIDKEGSANLQNLAASNKSDNKAQDSWQIKIGDVNFKNGTTQLIDKSVEPQVNNSIIKINGSIKDLSSDNLSKADISMSGLVNQFSKLEIKGQINPLSSDAYTDLDITVSDLDLHHFSSYAATYVGYPVTGGKLDLKMNYKLNKHKLEGKNYFYLQQLNLGLKNNSPDAVKLPIKMAMTLLSDSKGNIEINLPVSGNINDPEFSYGGLIGKAIFKLITSMVASPFKVLGLLIPNADPQMNQIRFLEGQHNIDPTEEHKFDQITAILEKKPKLKLQLTPILNDITDSQALKQQLLLEKIKLSELNFSDIQLRSWIEQQLADLPDAEINYPEAWKKLLDQQVLPEGQLLELSHKRTENIKLKLINKHNIPAERIFVNSTKYSSETTPMIEIGVAQ